MFRMKIGFMGGIATLGFTMLVLAMALLLPTGALAQTGDSPWTGSGSGTTTVVSDGSSAPAEFTYDNPGPFSGSWEFKTTAASAGTHELDWVYSGFHSFFQVTARLDAFVDDGTTVNTINLVNAGPENCCTSPSNGFLFSGTETFIVQPGDVYGFKMSGSHFDSNPQLSGRLTVTERQQRPGVCGDQNDDGNVDIFDAIIDLQIIVGLIVPTPEQLILSDVVRDGQIDIFDVILTLQHLVGLTEITECGP